MQAIGKVFDCSLHCQGGGSKGFSGNTNDCAGQLVTRQSIYGAVTKGCMKGWGVYNFETLWPETLSVEEP